MVSIKHFEKLKIIIKIIIMLGKLNYYLLYLFIYLHLNFDEKTM